MTTILSTLFIASVTGCHNDDYGSCIYLSTVAELTPVYDYQWEYSTFNSFEPSPNWESIWPTLGFSRSYQELKPKIPNGLRTIVYDDDEAFDIRNIAATGGTIYSVGRESSILVFNNDTEYDVIIDTDEETSASVSTRRLDRPGFIGSAYAPDATILTTTPDVLFHCFIPEIYNFSLTDTLKITAPMFPLVYTYAVMYKFTSGLQYVAVARGALAGMSRGAWLWDGVPLDHRVSVGYDANIGDNAVEAYVKSFGHPIDEYDDTYGLLLEVRLKNGKILNYDFDITCQMRYQPCGGVIIVDGIEIPDSIGSQPTGGGFDVKVDGWGEFEDIPIQF